MSQRNSQTGVFLVLKKEYTDLQHYQSVKENSLQLNTLFQALCSNFITTFEALSSAALLPSPPASPSRVHSYPGVSCLTRFAIDFSSLMREVADYHIVCMNRQRQLNRPDFQAYSEFAQQLNGLNAANEQIEVSKGELDSLFKQIKLDFMAYRKNTDDPLKYYDAQYIQKTNSKLTEVIERAQQATTELGERRSRLAAKVNSVERVLSRFKCKLVKNKYGVLKHVRQFVHNGHSCFAEINQLIKQCVLNHKGIFLQTNSSVEEPSQLKEMLNRSTQISIENPLDENRRWEVAIRATLDACCHENQAVERVLQQFEQYFTAIWRGYEERKGRIRQIVARLSQFYEATESPLQSLLGLIGLQDELQERLRTVGGRVASLGQSLRQHKRACLKHGQIVLSLLKIKNKRKEGLLDSQDGMARRDLSQLVTEITATTPKDQIVAFYDSWLSAQREVAQTLRQMTRPRSKSSTDSMEVSYSQNMEKLERKRPLREEMWLWRDPIQQVADNTDQYLNYFQEVRKFAAQMQSKFGEKQGVELQKYECVLADSKIHAALTITTSGLGIAASDSKIRLGWKDVLSLQAFTNFFDKGLAVATPQGKIELLRLSKPVETVIEAIRQAQQKGMMGKVKVQARQQVVLTPEETQRIEARRKQINSEVPTTDDYKLIVAENLEGVRIDEVYQWVYSDEPFNFYGRQEPCFFSYTGKKAGNINWQAEKYDRPGPYFYSLQEGITFQNCPLFSVRKISYNHPMKPSSIPFMPKHSRNEDQRRMYWLSHQELIYHIKSLTYDVPMADNFEVHILHRITALPSATRVEIYSQVKFVKQTSFKNIIFSNTDPEIDENMLGFMAEVTKLFRLRKEAAQGGEVPIEPEPIVPQVTAESGEVEKLRGYNRLLLGALLLVLLVELLRILLA